MEIIPTPWSVVPRSIAVNCYPPNSYAGWLDCKNVRLVRFRHGCARAVAAFFSLLNHAPHFPVRFVERDRAFNIAG
jgi:hypothetical protein